MVLKRFMFGLVIWYAGAAIAVYGEENDALEAMFSGGTVGKCGAIDCRPCACVHSSDKMCYVGALDFGLREKDAREFNVLYDGTALKVRDSVFCFEEAKNVDTINMLFIDPSHVRYLNEGNTVSGLAISDGAKYDFYSFTRQADFDHGAELVAWLMARVRLSEKEFKGAIYSVVPEHTIIIPLEARYFVKAEDGSVRFEYQSLRNNECATNLPKPAGIKAHKRAQVISVLVQADLALLNLKSIHASQAQKRVRLDKQTLVQEQGQDARVHLTSY